MNFFKVIKCILCNEIGSFGPDIEDMLQDIGTPYTILRSGETNILGEKCLYKLNKQVTKPFIREFFIEATLSYDTEVVAGDIIQFTNDSRTFIIATNTPRNFEGQAFDNQAVFYKCNVLGELKRHSGEIYNSQTYKKDQVWDSVKTDLYGLMTEEIFGNYLDQETRIGQVQNQALFLYVSSSEDIQSLDRFEAVSGEYYKVEEIEKNIYPGIHICHLEVDTR